MKRKRKEEITFSSPGRSAARPATTAPRSALPSSRCASCTSRSTWLRTVCFLCLCFVCGSFHRERGKERRYKKTKNDGRRKKLSHLFFRGLHILPPERVHAVLEAALDERVVHAQAARAFFWGFRFVCVFWGGVSVRRRGGRSGVLCSGPPSSIEQEREREKKNIAHLSRTCIASMRSISSACWAAGRSGGACI